MTRLRDLLVDAPNSLGARTRRKRWSLLRRLFPDLDNMRVVDLGGRASSWMQAPIQPAHVVVYNLGDFIPDVPTWIEQREGDACNLALLKPREQFDLVYSNSLLEHVGGHYRRRQFADSVHKPGDEALGAIPRFPTHACRRPRLRCAALAPQPLSAFELRSGARLGNGGRVDQQDGDGLLLPRIRY